MSIINRIKLAWKALTGPPTLELRLSKEDQQMFLDVINNPPQPNEAMRRAFEVRARMEKK